jgi:hypothetical protein
MSAVPPPSMPQAGAQQIQQLSAVYQISKAFPNSPYFSPEERAQLQWIANNPNVQQMLDGYAAARAQQQEMIKNQVYMFSDGSQGTLEQRDAYLASANVTAQLNNYTANIMGAAMGNIALNYFPGDTEMLTKMSGSGALFGEMGAAAGEGIAAGHELQDYRPFEPGMKQYAPGERELNDPPAAPDGEDIPIGAKTFNPYERETEVPEDSRDEPSDSTDDQPVDMGVPMGVPADSLDPIPDAQNDPADGDEGKPYSEDPSVNQSFPADPVASYPEDGPPDQSPASSPKGDFSSQPNASFPEDPIVNQSPPDEPLYTPQEPAEPAVPVAPPPAEAPFYTEPAPTPLMPAASEPEQPFYSPPPPAPMMVPPAPEPTFTPSATGAPAFDPE